jgi:hypothetical protein
MVAAFALAALVSSQAVFPKADDLTPGAIVLLANKNDTQATETLRRALTSVDPLVRRAAGRVAAVAHAEVFDALRQALQDERDARVAAEFVRDIMALAGADALPRLEPQSQRLGIDGAIPIAEWFARMQPDAFIERLPDWPRTPEAADRLAPIVALAANRHPELRERILAAWKPIASDKAWKRFANAGGTENHAVTMRTPPGLAAQVMASTLTAAHCSSRRDMIASALVTYSPSGRPTRIELNVARLPEACRNVLTAIARVGLDQPDSDGRPQTVIVPLTPDFVSCVAEADPAAPPHPAGPASGVKDPILKKEVKPDYAQAALKRKVEGVEELDVILSRTGCVKSAAVTRSLDPDLDAQGVIAVIQWRFQPGTLEGTAVSVMVAVELTFTLRR